MTAKLIGLSFLCLFALKVQAAKIFVPKQTLLGKYLLVEIPDDQFDLGEDSSEGSSSSSEEDTSIESKLGNINFF